jgi:sulfate adenylyltransferase
MSHSTLLLQAEPGHASSSAAHSLAHSLIAPHGGVLVDRVLSASAATAVEEEAERWPSVTLSSAAAADLEMIATGALSPLTGFLDRADYGHVLTDLRLTNGLAWTIPVTLRVDEVPKGDRIALRDADGVLRGVLELREAYAVDWEREARLVYGTTDLAHPGVQRISTAGRHALGGDVWLVRRGTAAFPALALDPRDTRRAFAERGWRTVVGFQTRNPVHRAHEYIQKAALETVDGLLLHPLVGDTKGDDVPVAVRVKSYEVLLEHYYPRDRVLLAAFPAAMRYAGPREAIFHAIARKNYGCTHFIVGRDHAGVGSYYGTYDAQLIFNRFDPAEIGIQPVRFEHTFFCRTCDSMASSKTCPHEEGARVTLSGTRVRELLHAGELPPPEFSRPEVARVLVDGLRERAA